MDKNALIKATVKRTGFRYDETKRCIEAFLDAVKEAIEQEETVSLTGIGTLSHIEKKAHLSTNPRTGKRIQVPQKKSLKIQTFLQVKNKTGRLKHPIPHTKTTM